MTDHLVQLQQASRVRTKPTPVGPALDLATSPLRNVAGRVIGTIWISWDITDLKRTEPLILGDGAPVGGDDPAR